MLDLSLCHRSLNVLNFMIFIYKKSLPAACNILELCTVICGITLYQSFDIMMYMDTCKPQTLSLKCCNRCVMSSPISILCI